MLHLAASAPGSDAIDAGTEEPGPPNPVPNVNDALVLERLTALLSERRLYRDPDLTLDRLSCRLGIPARQVSGAINRQLGCNVSQAINDWRIREAMRLLLETARLSPRSCSISASRPSRISTGNSARWPAPRPMNGGSSADRQLVELQTLREKVEDSSC
ncbi:hypothetical protein M3484_10440 [Pseudomonas sp. GX19020]|uniref:helix-turn-helix domain-containing protein n=1 Tax=Pseudomonas sp. GX19020 TaxID=2942277 RepID=UPI0020185129|nr:hypothetical protein [Pseudomonas sp. GX19020]MCL4066990.1 hypothetical protein [Pseudomonas sp. GX19020]